MLQRRRDGSPTCGQSDRRRTCRTGLTFLCHRQQIRRDIPLYRQQDELARASGFLARSTLCDWIGQCAIVFRPLVDLMRSRVLLSHVINADETPVPVLDPTRDSTRKSYLWTYLGDCDHPFTVFDYRDSRNRDGATEILENYRGYLQTDAYTCYDSVVLRSKGLIIPVGCWAHVREGSSMRVRTSRARPITL